MARVKSEAPATPVEMITDLELDKKIIACRAWAYGEREGYSDSIRDFAVKLGLLNFGPFTSYRRTYRLTEASVAALRESIKDGLEFQCRYNSTADLRSALLNKVYDNLVNTVQGNGDATGFNGESWADTTGEQMSAADAAAILATYGGYDPYTSDHTMPPASPEVEAQRREIMVAAMAYGDASGTCGTLEAVCKVLGLGTYLPSREKVVTVTIPGTDATVDLTVQATRSGEVTEEVVKRALRDHVYSRAVTVTWQEKATDTDATAAPVAA